MTERARSAARTVDDGHDEQAFEIARGVVARQLRRGRELTDGRAEVDAQLVSGLPRLRKILNVYNPPDADIDAFELRVGKGCRFASHCAET